MTASGENLKLWNLDRLLGNVREDAVDAWRFLKLLDKVTGTELQKLNRKTVETVAVDAEGKLALAGFFDGKIERWGLETCREDQLHLEADLARRHAELGLVGVVPAHNRCGLAGISAFGLDLHAWDWYGDELASWKAHSKQ